MPPTSSRRDRQRERRQRRRRYQARRSRRVVDENTRESILSSMKSIARDNNGKISLFKSTKKTRIDMMLEEGLISLKSGSNERSRPDKDVIALDCEMVGVGPNNQSALGRCSIVSYNGTVLYDDYIKPLQPITYYRTQWSGICPHHMLGAKPFIQATNEIKQILAGKIVVGHDLRNDFRAIGVSHPPHLVRDTSELEILQQGHQPSLKVLTKVLVDRDIQQREGHSSLEDAQACLTIYKQFQEPWENGQKLIQFDDYFAHDASLLPQSSSEDSSSCSNLTPPSSPQPHPPELEYVVIHCDLVRMRSGDRQVGCCVVLDHDGLVLYHSYLCPSGSVKNFNRLIEQSVKSAPPVDAELPTILRLLKGKIVIGHKLTKQLNALNWIKMDNITTKDTAKSQYLKCKVGMEDGDCCSPTLQELARKLLSRDMKRTTLDKANTILDLYKTFRFEI